MRAIVITISDKGYIGERIDTAGPAIKNMLIDHKYNVLETVIVPDEYQMIKNELLKQIDDDVNLILTVGGTGFSKRDITPEVTNEVVDRLTPGLNEAMRYESLKITNRAMLSRASSGIKNNSLIVNLPGSEKAATENLSFILDTLFHGLQILLGEDANCGVPIQK